MSQTNTKPYHVTAIGNAIVDVLSFSDDSLIVAESMKKGTMCLIDEQRAEELYNKMGPSTEVSGGSAANTLAGLASLGARTAFIGKVYKDQLGKIFRHDLQAVGVEFSTPAAETGKATARCLILVTPDGQRTMNTFIGACNELYEKDIDAGLIASSQIVYGEGYMWDQPCTKEALKKAFKLAKETGAKIAFTLSDVFCVERAREDFLRMVDEDFDILFCNEAEVKSLYPGKTLEEIMDILEGKCEVVAITCGERGSVILNKGERIQVAAVPVHEVIDTTGAGDLYAAGFLYGYTHGLSMKECGRLGSACASDIITHLGARAQRPLTRLLTAA